MATFPDGRENFASESGFAEFDGSNFSSAGALHRTSSMSGDDSPRSALSDITHLFLCNINGSAAAMEPSFGNATASDSPSWEGGRRGGERYYSADRPSSRITRKSNLLLGFR
ncbi:hypothetical protein O6H91_23G008100 [Diphasiastrum complanatum]|uniref:Uncharacterized protein n=2 Tax=Diphasiastrum complanatum TaxID=34168 RepID=A0ACC2A7X3_DIPCM|nr:hypothetical protein O6H91_23G007100 [Diphasiastrum complanatum]KAJ7513638.1 hypothetical protein O6H91_23G008100 [Diphasiastrum complanatum]